MTARTFRPTLEPLEARLAPAQVLSPTRLTYQDKDGDMVVVSFTKPILSAADPNSIFRFDSGAGAVNGETSTPEQLQRIDLTVTPVESIGVGVAVRVVRKAATGDGSAAVGEIDGTNIAVGSISVQGDLGRIVAGGGPAVPGARALSVQSLGRYGTSTGAADTTTSLQGELKSLRVSGDVDHASVDAGGGIGTFTVGGSLNSGSISTPADLGRGMIRGDIDQGNVVVGTFAGGTPPGATLGSLTVGGKIIGGSQSGSADLVGSGAVLADHIKHLTIGGSLIAGTNSTSGTYWANGAVYASYDIGSILIKGDVVGNASNLAVIAAGGAFTESNGNDLAIGSVTVKGRVERGLIEAGVGPVTQYAYQPVDADAQIGSVIVGGDWIASSVAAGVVAGSAGFGSPDDARMSGQGVRDDPAVSSEIRSIAIGGQVQGTAAAGDHFGFVAEEVGRLMIAGTKVPLAPGIGNDDVSLAATGDVSVHEV